VSEISGKSGNLKCAESEFCVFWEVRKMRLVKKVKAGVNTVCKGFFNYSAKLAPS